MTAEQLDEFGRRCRLSNQSLALIRNSCCRFVALPELRKLLLFQIEDGIDYRFCLSCWREEHIPYLRLDWRFRNVTYCRTHGERLESRCISCEKPLATHRSVLGSGSHPAPVLNLAICPYCRKDMRKMPKKTTYFDAQPSRGQISFQNAIISAVLHGHFQSETGGRRRPVEELPEYLEETGAKGEPTIIVPFGNPP